MEKTLSNPARFQRVINKPYVGFSTSTVEHLDPEAQTDAPIGARSILVPGGRYMIQIDGDVIRCWDLKVTEPNSSIIGGLSEPGHSGSSPFAEIASWSEPGCWPSRFQAQVSLDDPNCLIITALIQDWNSSHPE